MWLHVLVTSSLKRDIIKSANFQAQRNSHLSTTLKTPKIAYSKKNRAENLSPSDSNLFARNDICIEKQNRKARKFGKYK